MRLDSLTSLRFFAAFAIFLHHSIPFGVSFSSHLFGFNLGAAVSFFFVLSGFVLSHAKYRTLEAGGAKMRFIVERWFRIWPLHIVCGIIFIYSLPAVGSFSQFYLYSTLQHSWVPSYSTGFFLNAVSWSISVELFFYIIFAFLATMSVQILFTATVICICAVFGVMAAASWYPQFFPFSPLMPNLLETGVTQGSFFYFFPPIRLPEFLAGMVTYRIFRAVNLTPRAATLAQCSVVLIAALIVVFFWQINSIISKFVPIVAAQMFPHYGLWPFCCLFIWAFAYQSGALAQVLSIKPLIYLGEISFSMYMIHQIIISNMDNNFGMRSATTVPESWVWTAIALAVTLVSSALLYAFVETPPRRLIKRMYSRD